MREDGSATEEAALYVMGLLDGAQAAEFEARMGEDAALGLAVASLNNATVALARAVPRVALPASLRERLMASIAEPPSLAEAVPAGFHVVRHDEEGWLDTPIPGFRIKVLVSKPGIGYEMLMVEFAPGTRYPAHQHEAPEQLFVFSGTLQTEGRVLGAGDFIHGEAGSHHQELYSHEGCRAVLVRRAA